MDEDARKSLASVARYLELHRHSDCILSLPFPASESELETLNGHPGVRALIHAGRNGQGGSDGSLPSIDGESAIWRLPACGATDIVFAGPWWRISRQMIGEARKHGIRRIAHHSWGRWIENSPHGLVAMKIVRRLVRYPVVEVPDRATKLLARLIWRADWFAQANERAKRFVFGHPWLKRAMTTLLPADWWRRAYEGLRRPAIRNPTVEDFSALLRDARPADDFVARRVVLVCGSLQPGGAERQVVNTLLGLRGQRLESVRLLCDRLTPGHPERYDHYLPLLEGSGLEVASLLDSVPPEGLDPGGGPESMERVRDVLPIDIQSHIDALYRRFLHIRPEVVHAWLDWSNTRAGLAAVLAGVPRIVLACRNINPSNFGFYHPHMDPAYRALAGFPNVTFVNNSRAGAADYARWLGIPESRFEVVYNGVSMDGSRRASPGEIANLRANLGIPPDHMVVGSTFRLYPEKRPLLWIECAAAIAAQRPDTSFVIYGQGILQREMMRRARRLGIADRLHLPGVTDDIVAALSAMDALLLTSYGEGTPNVALEAQWLGIPVIATEAGGVAESIDQGVTGAVVPTTEPETLARRVVEYLDDPDLRARCERSGNRFIRERFGIDRMIAETMALYGYRRRRGA